MLRSPEVMLLCALAGVAAWVLLPTGAFEPAVALGVVSLFGALFSFESRALRWTRITARIIGFVTLPGVAAVEIGSLASVWPEKFSPPPMSSILTLPVASEGRFDDGAQWGTVVGLSDNGGQFLYKGAPRSLEELRERYRGKRALGLTGLILYADQDTPWRLVGCLVHELDERDVGVFVRKYIVDPSSPEEPALLGAEERVGQYWPMCSIALRIADAPPNAPKLSLTSIAFAEREWGRFTSKRELVQAPTRVRYRLGARETESLRDLARWIRDERPGAIEADDMVPLKFVVAAANVLLKAGTRDFVVGPVRTPTAPERAARLFPYPASPAKPPKR